jgi:hypothetical protein
MSTPKKSKAPAESLELYEKLVATNPDVERKGAANPYTSLNGHMFSYLHPSGSTGEGFRGELSIRTEPQTEAGKNQKIDCLLLAHGDDPVRLHAADGVR